ncbi:MAG TPA: flavin reductase family protein [Tepidisphaeraceae bacterium]|nr:flavin reductase family protein [Tepidisphaeraceae bacterium]
MIRKYSKKDFPVDEIRHYLEPGPTVLVTSSWQGKQNVMTMGWQTTMEFNPSLVGCVIANSNFSFELIRGSGECVINVPTVELARIVVKIGNCSGDSVDKFRKFKLTTSPASVVAAPLIDQCVASFECKLVDDRLIKKYNFFIFEIVKAHAARSPKYPKTIHYHGHGKFTVAGGTINLHRLFTKWKE